MTTPSGRGRVQFLLLATLFFAPFVAAWVLYFYMPERIPSGTTNYGRLVAPARPLPAIRWLKADGSDAAEAWRGRWTLVHLADSGCAAQCVERLVLTRQTRAALNEKRGRVQRVILARDEQTLRMIQGQLGAEHPDLVYLRAADAGFEPSSFFEPGGTGTIFLLDPLGNYLMWYPYAPDTQAEFKGIKKDLTKLLRVSQIG